MFRVGDKVQVSHSASRRWAGTQWTVIKVNSKTYKLQDEAGGILNCAKSLVVAVGKVAAPRLQTRTLPHATCGSFLKYVGRSSGNLHTNDVVVVLKDNFDKVKCTLAGGSSDRYWNVPTRLLTDVTAKVVEV